MMWERRSLEREVVAAVVSQQGALERGVVIVVVPQQGEVTAVVLERGLLGLCRGRDGAVMATAEGAGLRVEQGWAELSMRFVMPEGGWTATELLGTWWGRWSWRRGGDASAEVELRPSLVGAMTEATVLGQG